MSPLPAQMTDRWHNRSESEPGQGTYYWHMLVGRYPQARAIAQEAHDRLAPFAGLHYTPLPWLHITTLVVGSTNDISMDQAHTMLTEVSGALASVPPVEIFMERVIYHPQGILLGVEPAELLRPIRDAVQAATKKTTGREGYTEGPSTWAPHMTIAYSTADQPATPLVEALGKRLSRCALMIDSVSLVIQHGPERQWDWQHLGAALFLGS
jgi:2'-5' RNA ligase